MRIAAVGRALPAHHYRQDEILGHLRAMWSDHPQLFERLHTLHGHVQVGGRYLLQPMEAYADLTFGTANDLWIAGAMTLGETAVRDALVRAALEPRDIDAFFFVSVTGIASPSIDARLVNRLQLKDSIKRIPIFGLGCVAGAAGVARAADYVRAYPDQTALVLSVEICSLTFQRDDRSIANMVASGLFGDGAAAALVVGHERAARSPMGKRGPSILASRSVFYPDTEDVMGWQISEKGFRIVLSADVPRIARECLGRDVDAFLREHGLARADIRAWVCHPGGPKVLQALQEALELPPGALAITWRGLAEHGNLSSTSVMMVLADTMDTPPPPGSFGLMLAMGPGFCSELVLLRW